MKDVPMIPNKKHWLRLILALILLTALPGVGACHSKPNTEQPILSDAQTFFPQLLRGLTWTYNEKLIRQRMPGITPEDTGYTDYSVGNGKNMIDSVYFGVSLKPLGPAAVEIDHDTDNNIDLIQISSYESRSKICDPAWPKRPRGCKNQLDKHLLHTLEKLKRYIASVCGPPKVLKLGPKPGVYDQDWYIVYKWKLESANLNLAADEDESGWWTVDLQITKPKSRKASG